MLSAMPESSSLPPPPRDLSELPRVRHTALRRRLLYSEFEADLVRLMEQQLGTVRRDAWGHPDLTANPYLSLWSQSSRLYAEEPDVVPPDASAAPFVDALATAGVWAMMQRVQRDTLALREMLVRLDVVDGGLTMRTVSPDFVEASSHPRNPSQPVRVTEAMQIGSRWFRVVTDVSDPAYPSYYAEDEHGVDASDEVLGGRFDGAAYPYRDSAGAPILPFVLYHAALTGCLWDPYTMREVVEGSLNIGLLLTYYQHVVRNCAFAQRYIVGAEVMGAGVEGDAQGTRRAIVTDPASVLMLDVGEGGAQPLIGQWVSPVDPEGLLRPISMYERRILLLAGLAPPDVAKQEADIRSGYSLAVQRESVREAQRLYEPMFRRGDTELLRVAAALINGATGTAYPETGYRIVYRGLPPSPVEEGAEREHVLSLLAAGLIDRVSAYQRIHPGTTPAEASAALAAIAAERQGGMATA